MILTSLVGTNDALIERVAQLYIRDGMKVADVTYGKGVFWKRVNTARFQLIPSDIETVPDARHDFRKLPYPDNSFDVVVLDPPYMHSSATKTVKDSIAKCYGNNGEGGGVGHTKIVELYRHGMREAERILKLGGTLWVKCQDEIESGVQRWSHIEIFNEAYEYGFNAIDLFVLMQSTTPAARWKHQLHARKNHSYLWIFQK